VTGRYVSKLRETGGNVMRSRFYTDVQLRFTTGEDDAFGFALGVNNLFKTRAPGCVTCDINNFDPTAYDLPGRYFYARASVKM
jgi:iron complex outermembrane receptor protein